MLGWNTLGGFLPLSAIAEWHPQFALAAADGVPCRPNNRTLQAKFSSTATGVYVDANFQEQISIYSIFTGFDYTIDPTNAFAGSSQKGQSDYFSEQVSGVLFNLAVRGGGDEYFPIRDNTPLQLCRTILNGGIGQWAMWNAQNVFGRFTIDTPPAGETITCWAVFGFLVMGSQGASYLCLDRAEARRQLREKHGILCACGPSSPIVPQMGQPPAQGGPGAAGAPGGR
jgi:hypothetical protein